MFKPYFFAGLLITMLLLCGPLLNAGKPNNRCLVKKTVVEPGNIKLVSTNEVAAKKVIPTPLLPAVLL